jgi:hypothetical protein
VRAYRCALPTVGVGGEADAAVCADVVAAGGSSSSIEAIGAAYGPAPGSLALMSVSRPLSRDANESLPVAASVLGSWLPLWGWNRSSVCNGTLNASVFVHCGCRGLNMYVFFGTEPCFFFISSTETRLVNYLNRFAGRELPRAKVTSEVSVSRRSRSPSARSALAAYVYSVVFRIHFLSSRRARKAFWQKCFFFFFRGKF